MFEGISDQLEEIAAAVEEAEDDTLLPVKAMPPDKATPVTSEKKAAPVKHPRRTTTRKPKAPVEEGPVEEVPAETPAEEATGEDSGSGAGELPDSSEDAESADTSANWPPDDTPPWEPPKEEPPKEESSKAEPQAEVKGATPKTAGKEKPAVTITKDDIRSVIVAKIKQKRDVNDKVQSLLQAYGVSALSDLPDDKHEAFLADISQL